MEIGLDKVSLEEEDHTTAVVQARDNSGFPPKEKSGKNWREISKV